MDLVSNSLLFVNLVLYKVININGIIAVTTGFHYTYIYHFMYPKKQNFRHDCKNTLK